MALLSPHPTYIPTSNCDYLPDDLITLGTLLADPWKPDRRLNKASPVAIPASSIRETFQADCSHSLTKLREHKLTIWTGFVQMITGVGADVGGSVESGVRNVFHFDRIDTRYFLPDEEYIRESLEAPGPQSYIKATRRLKPMYMVVGVKIARGASAANEKSREIKGTFKVGVDGTALGVPVSLGPEAETSAKNERTASFKQSSDFVFAYRLIKISPRLRGEVSSKDYDKGALYGLDDSAEAEDIAENFEVAELRMGAPDSAEVGLGLTVFDELDGDEEEYCDLMRR